jgi:hypothetical protein
MAKGGYKPGGGRPRKKALPDIPVEPSAIWVEANAEPGKETPLVYMLRVMNDPAADQARRDRMSIAAAPFVHPKVGEVGKKEGKQGAAKVAGTGKFAPAEAPRLVVNNQ